MLCDLSTDNEQLTTNCLLLLRNRFVQIQHHAGHRCPGGQVGGRRAGWNRSLHFLFSFVIVRQQRPGIGSVAIEPLLLAIEKTLQDLCSSSFGSRDRHRRTAYASRSRVRCPAFGQQLHRQCAGTFDKQRFVERRQRLQRRVRPRAAGAGEFADSARRTFCSTGTEPSGSGTCKARGGSDPGRCRRSTSSARSWPAAGTGTPAPADTRSGRRSSGFNSPLAASAMSRTIFRIDAISRPAREQPISGSRASSSRRDMRSIAGRWPSSRSVDGCA